MKTKTFAAVATIVLLAGACARQAPPSADTNGAAAAPAATAAASLAARSPRALPPEALRRLLPAARPALSRAAALPDHGELVAYPGRVARQAGAYTWHRAAISEAHALAAIATGRLRLTTPDGRLLDVRYDRHVQHDSGDWTWIGHLAGQEGVQTVLTIGADAVFGSIGQDAGLPLRLTMRDGLSWLVETDAAQVAALDNAATRPSRPDFHVPRQPRIAPRAAASAVRAPQPEAATATAGSTVDLLVGYTDGLRAAYGSTSAVQTRIHNLVDTTNTAYGNGGVQSRVRLVHTMEVDYRDDTDNQEALEELSGYEAGVGPTTPAPAFAELRAARETYGADLVSLVRDFRDPENDGCGIAWLLGGGLQGIAANEGWDTLGYSVVSDGSDQNEEDGNNYFCRETTFAHELGHNMGAAHDEETAQGSDGTLDNPDDYGAFPYSFGYKASQSQGNFYTVMAYGDSGQTGYTIFSTPDTTFCGGDPCGTDDADNVRTLDQTMPVVAGFRPTVVPNEPTEVVDSDFNGDGVSDVLWRNTEDGRNRLWLSADSTDDAELEPADLAWRVAAVGDFDGDGVADIYWRNQSSGENEIWRSGDPLTQLATQDLDNAAWHVAGAGDFNGDGEDDILWRNFTTGANTIWHSGNQSSRKGLTPIADTDWEVVGIGDFDEDGEADIFWRHAGTGKNTVWYSGDRANRVSLRRVADTAWIVAGIGDFNGDGNDDVLWRNVDDGRNTIWKSANGSTKQAVVRVAGTSWQVGATGDYDGNGEADIFWRNTANGDNVLWPGADRSERDELASFPLDWAVVP